MKIIHEANRKIHTVRKNGGAITCDKEAIGFLPFLIYLCNRTLLSSGAVCAYGAGTRRLLPTCGVTESPPVRDGVLDIPSTAFALSVKGGRGEGLGKESVVAHTLFI